jgi:hypothetical protein
MRDISSKVTERIKTYILGCLFFFFLRKPCRLWENVEKYGGTREDAENMAPALGIMHK